MAGKVNPDPFLDSSSRKTNKMSHKKQKLVNPLSAEVKNGNVILMNLHTQSRMLRSSDVHTHT